MLGIDSVLTPILGTARYDADRRMTHAEYGPSSPRPGFPIVDEMRYDARKRPRRMKLSRTPTEADLGDHPLGAVRVVTDTVYAWDAADSADLAPPSQFPAGYRPRRQTASHDALYRVTSVATDYGGVDADGLDSGFTPDDLATDWRDERERTNLDGQTHQDADPMRRRPAPMASRLPEGRTADLQYRFDWLGNMTEWTD
ncbi:MAG: hypothetical protein GXP55_12375, partial [Deltaproteobacteria bacterium]|nr:hypothetical protein [Deltaproteobacteria bacterium]